MQTPAGGVNAGTLDSIPEFTQCQKETKRDIGCISSQLPTPMADAVGRAGSRVICLEAILRQCAEHCASMIYMSNRRCISVTSRRTTGKS
jgi:hypothetical protein